MKGINSIDAQYWWMFHIHINVHRMQCEGDSMWLDDNYWFRAGKYILENAKNYPVTFAPEEFNGIAPRCYPLLFTHHYSMYPRGLLVFPKCDVDKLPLYWIENITRFNVLYADEVFVALDCNDHGSSEGDVCVNASEHIPILLDMAAKVLNGESIRKSSIDTAMTTRNGSESYVLLITDSTTGNGGDRLITQACIDLMKNAWPHLSCIVSDNEFDRQLLANSSAVVFGPGGRIFDIADDSRLDMSNFIGCFAPAMLAKEYNIPYFGLGMGVDRVGSRKSVEYMAEAMKLARLITTRNHPSTEWFLPYVKCPLLTMPDLSEFYCEQIRRLSSDTPANHAKVLAMTGDCRFERQFIDVMTEIANMFPELRFRYIIQATEDASTMEIHGATLDAIFKGRFEISDPRGGSISDFVSAIATSDIVMTSRFHTMEVAVMAGISTYVSFNPKWKMDKKKQLYDILGTKDWITAVRNLYADRKGIMDFIQNGKRDATRINGIEVEPFRKLERLLVSLL